MISKDETEHNQEEPDKAVKKKQTHKHKSKSPGSDKEIPKESANQPLQNEDDNQRKIVIKSIEGPNDMNFTITM